MIGAYGMDIYPKPMTTMYRHQRSCLINAKLISNYCIKPFEIELAMLATAMLATVCDQKRY
jgi:hypothetical protein